MCGFLIYIHIRYAYTHLYACEIGKVSVFDRSTLVYQCNTVVWFSLWRDSCWAAYSEQEDNEVEIPCGLFGALLMLFLESRSNGSCFNKEEAYLQGHSYVCSSLWTFVAVQAVVVNWTPAFSFKRIPLKGSKGGPGAGTEPFPASSFSLPFLPDAPYLWTELSWSYWLTPFVASLLVLASPGFQVPVTLISCQILPGVSLWMTQLQAAVKCLHGMFLLMWHERAHGPVYSTACLVSRRAVW